MMIMRPKVDNMAKRGAERVFCDYKTFLDTHYELLKRDALLVTQHTKYFEYKKPDAFLHVYFPYMAHAKMW